VSSITLEGVTADQLVSMADGLVASGQPGLAAQIYTVALKRAAPHARRRIRVRLGIANIPTRRTLVMLETLKALEGIEVSSPFVGDGLATWLKTLPFEDDERFLTLADRHAHLLPVVNWQWNLQVALWAVQEAKDVQGDLVELGVFKGHTTLFCAEYVDFQTWPKRWWLYDTFEGIPEDQRAPGWENLNDRTYRDRFSYEEVTARFAHLPNIRLIKGRVPESLAESPDRIAFLHVDLNNAPAEIGALEVLFDRVSPGGIILFDDFCWSTARAQYDQEKAWFAARGLRILPIPTGQGLFFKR